MKRIERSALVMYSCQQMFDVVNDVASYPEFVPGCAGAEVLSASEAKMVARLDLNKAGLKQSFVTCNKLESPHSICLALEDGPFKMLRGEWSFQVLSDNACKVVFWLEFEFSNALLTKTAGKVFEKVASEQVDAMCSRAAQKYANG